MTITPGIHHGIPHATYLADHDRLSASGMKLILPPSCPALFRYRMDHPEPPSSVFDLGTVTHSLVLGAGADVHVVDAPSWRTKAAKDEAEQARAAGLVPLLAHEHELAQAMADAVHAHPIAGPLLDPTHGHPEVTMAWDDPDTSVPCRARPDWLREAPGMRPVIVDLKTAASSNPDRFARSAAEYGYHVQAAHYIAGHDHLTGSDPRFVFVVVEKEPPHLVSVVALDQDAMDLGERQRRRALDLYRQCTTNDTWPGYTDVATVDLPAYIYYQEQQ